MKILNKPSIFSKNWYVGFLQATGVSLYITTVVLFMNQMADIFIKRTSQEVVMGIIMLMVFSVSALICGTLVLAYPIKLGVNKKVRSAIDIVLWTIGFLFVYLIVAILGSYLLSTEKVPEPQLYNTHSTY